MARWDIDKALAAIEGDLPGTALCRCLIPIEVAKESLGRPLTDKEMREGTVLPSWYIAFGPNGIGRKLIVYERTIRKVYLKARKLVKKMDRTELESYGLRVPKNPSNSYAKARRRKRDRK